jgi:hypothetical protein
MFLIEITRLTREIYVPSFLCSMGRLALIRSVLLPVALAHPTQSRGAHPATLIGCSPTN